ncbi:hypothetical protein ZWY2020_000189 [Hordeum vulgare]|nr:hypothetical protein ZWY2020_000189 [Hordeum vulgare]
METKNTTATFAKLFSSSGARLVRVEVLVLFSTLAWVLLELFGSFRRRYSHGFFRLLVWTVYTLSTVLAPYTIVNGSGGDKSYNITIWIFYIYSIMQTVLKFGNLSNVSKKGSLVAHSKVIADYMVVEHQLAQNVVDPSTMEGYIYIFDGEVGLASLVPSAPEYRVGLQEMAGHSQIHHH